MNLKKAERYLIDNNYTMDTVFAPSVVAKVMTNFAKQYAEDMCKEQRVICAKEINGMNIHSDNENINNILNAPLATEKK